MFHSLGLLEYSVGILVLIALGSYFYFKKPSKKEETLDSKDDSSLAPYKVEPPQESTPVVPQVVKAVESSNNVTLGNNSVSVVAEKVAKPKPAQKKPAAKAPVKPKTAEAKKPAPRTTKKPTTKTTTSKTK